MAPVGVRCTPSGARSNTRVPSSSSTRARARESVGWLVPSTAAVPVTCWWSASATSQARSRSCIPTSYGNRIGDDVSRHWTHDADGSTVGPMSAAVQTTAEGHRPGTAGSRRVVIALFAAGLATFALLYSTQAILPDLATQFGVSTTGTTLTVSLTTLGLGIALLVAGPTSDVIGRTR